MLEGWQLGGFIRQERRLFGLSATGSFEVPLEAKKIFSNELIGLLNGEIGIAFFPGTNAVDSWIIVPSYPSNPLSSALLAKTETMTERNGATIRSPSSGMAQIRVLDRRVLVGFPPLERELPSCRLRAATP